MFKILVFLLALLPATFPFAPPQAAANDCDCQEVTNLHKTGETSTTISYAWTGGMDATQYKVWYTRHADSYTSSFFYTTDPAYTFSNLSEGRHTFYFVAICGEESSGFVGIEDVITG